MTAETSVKVDSAESWSWLVNLLNEFFPNPSTEMLAKIKCRTDNHYNYTMLFIQ